MNQLRYSPFRTFNGLHNFGRLFDEDYALEPSTDTAGNWVPQVDIRELDTGYSVQIDLPGVEPKDVDVTVNKNVLTIKGSRQTTTETEEKGYKRLERFNGSFLRQFTLPETADGSKISAKANHGVLEISIPKTEKNKPLTIEVDS